MSALNEQTAAQFQQYGAQQFPGNPDQVNYLSLFDQWSLIIK